MSIEPIVEYFKLLPSHERQMLLDILEVAEKCLLLDCTEKRIFQSFTLALWKSVKIEEMK